MPWSGLPWYGQVILIVVLAIVAVFLFNGIVVPLLHQLR